jgi:hypothetical protein
MTSVLIVYEMTASYSMVLPLMIANMSAFALARHWRRTPLYEALLEQDGIYLPRRSMQRDLRGAAKPFVPEPSAEVKSLKQNTAIRDNSSQG